MKYYGRVNFVCLFTGCSKNEDCRGASCVSLFCHPHCTRLSECPIGL